MAIMAYERSYTTARAVASVLELAGWISVVIGAFLAFIGFVTGGFFSSEATFWARAISMLPGLASAIAGLFSVAYVQGLRANIDTAEMTRELLRIARGQNVKEAGEKSTVGLNADAAADSMDSPNSEIGENADGTFTVLGRTYKSRDSAQAYLELVARKQN